MINLPIHIFGIRNNIIYIFTFVFDDRIEVLNVDGCELSVCKSSVVVVLRELTQISMAPFRVHLQLQDAEG